MKKIIYSLAVLLLLIAFFLFLTTKISTAYTVARIAIDTSNEVKSSSGAVQRAILSSFSQKTGPTGKGCTTILFYVDGATSNGWFEVRLESKSYRTEWRVTAIRPGTGNFTRSVCEYG